MKRVDLLSLLQERFPDRSRKELYALILCGSLRVNGEKCCNPKELVEKGVSLEVDSGGYVSRGGKKLEKALDIWKIPVEKKGFLDVGASTGGFTDLLLQKGAQFVHAVDVGYNQIAYKLRVDKRVYLHEKTNITKLTSLTPTPDMAVADISFHSTASVAAHILSLTKEKRLFALIKPQFERPKKSKSEFNGVIYDDEELVDIVENVYNRLISYGISVNQILLSPITGRRGNREFLFWLEEAPLSPFPKIREFIKGLLRDKELAEI